MISNYGVTCKKFKIHRHRIVLLTSVDEILLLKFVKLEENRDIGDKDDLPLAIYNYITSVNIITITAIIIVTITNK